MELSVIIPVYNTEHYLRKCLDSVLGQSLKDMEIICVDDGSTDGSGAILDQYAALDERIRVIHKENSGLVQARKTGIQKARGKYAGYVDSDDWIDVEMYETLWRIAEQHKADMVSCGYIQENGMQVKFQDGFSEGLYQGEALDNLRDQIFFKESSGKPGIRASLCYKLFRTSLLRNVQMTVPDELSNCEDRVCTVACILEAEAVYILEKAFYHYMYRQNSMSHLEDPFYLDKLGRVYRAFRSMYQHPKFSEKMRIQCELYIVSKVLEGMNVYMGFPIPDLMWISPRWIERFQDGVKVVLYGAGRLGKVYYRQIVSDSMGRVQIVGWVDRNYQKLSGYPCKIEDPEWIKKADFDYVLLALADRQPAEEARMYLTEELRVDEKKIIWLEQREMFWEYAEAAGLLEDGQ